VVDSRMCEAPGRLANCAWLSSRIDHDTVAQRNNSGFRFLQKDDVGVSVAPQNAEILSIRRPVE